MKALLKMSILIHAFFLILSLLSVMVSAQESSTYGFRDTGSAIEVRVHDLISRLTLEEKVSQMLEQAPAINRLGIPAYGWWNECLHGVARNGLATVFPQAIGLAATFDPELINKMAEVISTEARAKYHDALRNGEYDRYKGLTFWSPNINIFRDPRWGRGQETYGEDPFLTSRIGVAFVKGLQGDDPDYLKVVATPKHYAVHSGPEPERHVFDARISDRDLWETYLPAFEATVREAGAFSVMCAYNRFRGEACCGSDLLLRDILRNQWGFRGYVVSDCGAIGDIYRYHKIADTPEQASAMALTAGTDLNCGETYQSLLAAVRQDFVSESQIDTALTRLFMARFKLGMFDPPEMVPYSKIPLNVNDSESHRLLNRQVARESVVLLKNDNNLLPLSKSLKKIAVIGPNADQHRVLLGNYFGWPSYFITPVEGIRTVVDTATEVFYTPGCPLIGDGKPFMRIPAELFSENGKPGLQAEYFNNQLLEGTPILIRREPGINDNWMTVGAVPGIGRNDFSIRWTGSLTPEETNDYDLAVLVDDHDGYRLYLDGELVIAEWPKKGIEQRPVRLNLTAGRKYDLRLEYFQAGGDAACTLEWAPADFDPEKEALEAAEKSNVVVFVGGLDAMLEGEEQEVPYPGFRGGDRTDLGLPAVQQKLLEKLIETGKPVVLVLCSGSALAVNWAHEQVPAIIQLWYPGAEGGRALADVLFGDYNPAGRLPVTFYQSIEDLPPFDDYDMQGRTYRYFEGDPLYPFGHGLSYTSFHYEDLDITRISPDSLDLNFKITNTGMFDGDEVIQIYGRILNAPLPVPKHSLIGIRRIHLKKGETRIVRMRAGLRAMAVYTDNVLNILPGEYRIFAGGAQPGYDTDHTEIISKTVTQLKKVVIK